jgi:hypothetical protein
MNKFGIGTICFIVGAAIGSASTYILRERLYEKRLEKEAESIKNTLTKLSATDSAEESTDDTEVGATEEIKKSDSDAPTKYSLSEGEYPDDEEETDDDYEDTEDWDDSDPDRKHETVDEWVERCCRQYEEEREELRESNPELCEYLEIISTYGSSNDDEIEAELITEELFNQNPWKYSQEHVMFYDGEDGDVHLADDDGNELYGWMTELGYYDGNFNPNLFLAYEDTVFIKNDKLRKIYEVTKSSFDWYDVQSGEAIE